MLRDDSNKIYFGRVPKTEELLNCFTVNFAFGSIS